MHRCQRNLKAAAGELQSRLQGEVMDQAALAPLQNCTLSRFVLPKVPRNSGKFMACECRHMPRWMWHTDAQGISMCFGIMSHMDDMERYKSLKADARCEVRSPTLLEPCLLRPGVVKTKPVQAGHCIQSLHNFYKIITVLCI